MAIHNSFRVGAQVFIEPGQGRKRVENWFRLLQEHGMTTARIRLFEDHVRVNDVWDFQIYDFAFDMAEKYNILLLITLFPSDDSVGGFKFPRDEDHQKEIAEYIKKTVLHYKNHPALDCWVLQNEPGVEIRAADEIATKQYNRWCLDNNISTETDWAHLNWEFFYRDYTTNYLSWIAENIKKHDSEHLTHVNNHQLFNNLSQYDFPKWMSFLSTLGVSIHASWHLAHFNRNQYTVAIAAHCSIIQAASFPKPFWVTELQGGNNIFSGYVPMSVNAKDIAQWVWTSVLSGAERVIFWTLNPRAKGHETGEWGMLTYQDEPTERLTMAKEISEIIAKNSASFTGSKPLQSGITLLYSTESMLSLEKVMSSDFDDEYTGRKPEAHILSLLAYYETLLEMGVACDIKDINQFNWLEASGSATVILANVIALDSNSIKNIYKFVQNGNKLIITGMTSFFDEKMQNVYQGESPFKEMTGADLMGFDFISENKTIDIEGVTTPVHMVIGEIKNYSGTVISQNSGKITGVRNKYGDGTVTWVPSLIGLGCWQNDNDSLSKFLRNELRQNLDNLPFLFEKHMPSVMMKTLESKNGYVSMIVNTNDFTVEVPLTIHGSKRPELMFGTSILSKNSIAVNSGDTTILKWI